MRCERYGGPEGWLREAAMFIVKGRLVGTILALLVAALGATLLSAGPGADESAALPAPPAPAALVAIR